MTVIKLNKITKIKYQRMKFKENDNKMLQKENKNINLKFLNLFFDKKSFVFCVLCFT